MKKKPSFTPIIDSSKRKQKTERLGKEIKKSTTKKRKKRVVKGGIAIDFGCWAILFFFKGGGGGAGCPIYVLYQREKAFWGRLTIWC